MTSLDYALFVGLGVFLVFAFINYTIYMIRLESFLNGIFESRMEHLNPDTEYLISYKSGVLNLKNRAYRITPKEDHLTILTINTRQSGVKFAIINVYYQGSIIFSVYFNHYAGYEIQ